MSATTTTSDTPLATTTIKRVRPDRVEPGPTTCAAYSAAHADKAEGREATCKRLPMHKGECRTTLHVARAAKVATSTKSTRGRRVTKEKMLAAATKLASGEMTPSAYMSLVSKFGQRRTRRALATVAPVA